MGIAKTRLVKELTVRQIVQDLATEWDDSEPDVMQYLADLMGGDSRWVNDEGRRVYYLLHIGTSGAQGTPLSDSVKCPISVSGSGSIVGCVERMRRESLGWDDLGATVSIYLREEFVHRASEALAYLESDQSPAEVKLVRSETFAVPVGKVLVNKEELMGLLRDKGLRIPSDWTGLGLTDAGRRKGGKRSKYDRPLQEAVNRVRDDLAKGKQLTLPNFKDWMHEHGSYEDPYVFEPPVPGCDDLYIDGSRLIWIDLDGRGQGISLVSLRRYFARAAAASKN